MVLPDLPSSPSATEFILLSLSLSWLYHSKAGAAQQNINESGKEGKGLKQKLHVHTSIGTLDKGCSFMLQTTRFACVDAI